MMRAETVLSALYRRSTFTCGFEPGGVARGAVVVGRQHSRGPGIQMFAIAETSRSGDPLVTAPMLEPSRRLRRDLPLIRIAEVAPGFEIGAHLIDDRRRI